MLSIHLCCGMFNASVTSKLNNDSGIRAHLRVMSFLIRFLVNEDKNIFTTDSVYPSAVKGFKICNNEVGCLWFLKILIIWEWIDWGLRAVGFIRTFNYREDINLNKIENVERKVLFTILWSSLPSTLNYDNSSPKNKKKISCNFGKF